jgi:hypothetical protein
MYGGENSIHVTSEFTYDDGRKGTVSADLSIYTVE